jgi:hypothetical protein
MPVDELQAERCSALRSKRLAAIIVTIARAGQARNSRSVATTKTEE